MRDRLLWSTPKNPMIQQIIWNRNFQSWSFGQFESMGCFAIYALNCMVPGGIFSLNIISYTIIVYSTFFRFCRFLALSWSNLRPTESQRISDKKGDMGWILRKGSGRKSGQAWINILSDLDSRTFLFSFLYFFSVLFFYLSVSVVQKRWHRKDKQEQINDKEFG